MPAPLLPSSLPASGRTDGRPNKRARPHPPCSRAAAISEACFLLKRDGQEAEKGFGLIEVGFLRSEFDLHAECRAVRDLMSRYREMPISFADACLLRMSEIHPDSVVWTLDRDFHAYRRHRRQTVPLVTPF